MQSDWLGHLLYHSLGVLELLCLRVLPYRKARVCDEIFGWLFLGSPLNHAAVQRFIPQKSYHGHWDLLPTSELRAFPFMCATQLVHERPGSSKPCCREVVQTSSLIPSQKLNILVNSWAQ